MQHWLLERALNHLISTGMVDTTPLNKKTIYFCVDGLPLNGYFVCDNNRIFVVPETDRAADVDISLSPAVLTELLDGKTLTELLKQDRIIVRGDAKTAQLLVDLLPQIKPDLEEILSRYTGDIIAHQAGKVAKKFARSNGGLEAIKDELTKLLINPVRSERFAGDKK